ncbi:MAG: hypothetical protein J6A63_03140 [Clostridia bacterium]|nr:hypothetical protein [Clostridia bacterium]
MKLNDIWGYGQLFGYSGVDGTNRFENDFIGTLTAEKIGIRFELRKWIKIFFPLQGEIVFSAITGDMIDAKTANGDFFVTFANADTIVGYSPVLPVVTGEIELQRATIGEIETYKTEFDCVCVCARKEDENYKFVVRHLFKNDLAEDTPSFLNVNVDELKRARYAYFENMPACKDTRYEKLYYKALSVQKVNVRSGEGQIPCTWTTPDRVPHKRMWLWDSVFHALAMVTYNPDLAKNSIRAVISQIHEDGFIPHMIDPQKHSNVTQPQVLSWGVWEIYKKTGDKAFLAEFTRELDTYLEWSMKNRDVNGNGLLEWASGSDAVHCRSDESGLDNSPRFDLEEKLDAVDFSTFLAHDALYLSYIFAELGETEKSAKWKNVYKTVADTVNQLLWDEETGAYYDRTFSGALTKVLTPASFFPLIAGIPSKAQAEKMVKTLTDKTLLWTKLPLASISQTHPSYSTDMWRGGVWFNMNYFVIKGLLQYGYIEIAEELIEKLLSQTNKWYEITGTVFEFYDSKGEVNPFYCERKGAPIDPPDWRKHIHSIADYNWSTCFALMFIQKELYIGERK